MKFSRWWRVISLFVVMMVTACGLAILFVMANIPDVISIIISMVFGFGWGEVLFNKRVKNWMRGKKEV
jgi:hypothetical protein